jgi:hypothetical protein
MTTTSRRDFLTRSDRSSSLAQPCSMERQRRKGSYQRVASHARSGHRPVEAPHHAHGATSPIMVVGGDGFRALAGPSESRCGSIADLGRRSSNVWFTLDSRHRGDIAEGP